MFVVVDFITVEFQNNVAVSQSDLFGRTIRSYYFYKGTLRTRRSGRCSSRVVENGVHANAEIGTLNPATFDKLLSDVHRDVDGYRKPDSLTSTAVARDRCVDADHLTSQIH